MLASASIGDLLALDAADPVVRLDGQALWRRLLAGRLDPDRLPELAVTFYLFLAGTARYLFSSKVSTLAQEDGKRVFRDLYEALTVPDADADRGWRALAEAVGADGRRLEEALRLTQPRGGRLRGTDSGVPLPVGSRGGRRRLGGSSGSFPDCGARWPRPGQSAPRPRSGPSVPPHQGRIAADVEQRIDGLVQRYLADPWKAFEARRAARECVFAWKSIGERIVPE